MDLARDLTHAWRVHNGDGTDITLRLAPYFKSLRVHDAPGRISDEVTLSLDAGKMLRFPKLSQKLRFYIGESSRKLVDLGDHYVTDYAQSGAPDTFEITARPLYFGGGADPADWEAPSRGDETKHRTWEITTLGAIGNDIAKDNGVTPAIDKDFAAYPFDFAEQRYESDMAFLGRLAAEAGGTAKIAAGKLVIGSMHSKSSYGSAAPMPSVSIRKEHCAEYSIEWSARDTPGRFRAHWYDPSTAASGSETFGSGEPTIDMIRQFATKLQAERAVNAAFNLRGRQRRHASLTLADMNLKLWVGSEVKLGLGWHPQVQGDWSVIEAIHELSPAGGQTAVALELTQGNSNG